MRRSVAFSVVFLLFSCLASGQQLIVASNPSPAAVDAEDYVHGGKVQVTFPLGWWRASQGGATLWITLTTPNLLFSPSQPPFCFRNDDVNQKIVCSAFEDRIEVFLPQPSAGIRPYEEGSTITVESFTVDVRKDRPFSWWVHDGDVIRGLLSCMTPDAGLMFQNPEFALIRVTNPRPRR